MKTFYVLLSPLVGNHPCIIKIQEERPRVPTLSQNKWYQITADNREQAKKFAKDRWYNGDECDKVWIG